MLMVCNVFAQQTEEKDMSIPTASVGQKQVVSMVYGPNGQLIPSQVLAPQVLTCVVNGITITTSGTLNGTYYPPSNNVICEPYAPFTGVGNWTGFSNTGFVTYTFSQPIISARIGYNSINSPSDTGTITINGASPIQLTNPCGVSINGNVLACNLPLWTYGDVGVTVSSATPFTSITLTNTGSSSGWVTNDPCNFTVTLPPPSPTIVNCPKIALGYKCFKNDGFNDTSFSVYNSSSNGAFNSSCVAATINGVPCTNANVTIEPITPMPFGCTFRPTGQVRIPSGTMPFNASVYYRFRSIANPAIFSETYRADFGITSGIITNPPTIYLHTGSNPIDTYNGTINILDYSQILTEYGGLCTYEGATLGTTGTPNTVSFYEYTESLYYMINEDGQVVFRPPYNGSNIPANIPTQELIYQMWSNTSPVFLTEGRVVIMYYQSFPKTSTTQDLLEKMSIAPNPSKEGIYKLSFEKAIHTATIEVYAITGEKVHTEKIENTAESSLQLSNLPKGLYTLKILTDTSTVTRKIVKE